MSKTIQSVLGLAGWLLLTFAAAAIGALFVPGEWYASLVKPAWNPPNWIFGPVWTVLYILMAVAAWLVWKRYGLARATVPLLLFVIQLVLNAGWSWLFFGLRRPDLAFIDGSIGLAEHHLGGPTCNPPVRKLLAGSDPVKVDARGSELLGIPWQQVGHINIANGILGCAD